MNAIWFLAPSTTSAKSTLTSSSFSVCKSKETFRIRSKAPGVSSLQTQPSQCDHRGCRLTTGGLLVIEQPHLCIKAGILRHDDQVIDGVEPKTNGVKWFVWLGA